MCIAYRYVSFVCLFTLFACVLYVVIIILCIYICVCVCVYIYIFMYMYVRMHVRMYVCLHVYMYVCIGVYLYTYVGIYLHTHTYIYVHISIYTYVPCSYSYMNGILRYIKRYMYVRLIRMVYTLNPSFCSKAWAPLLQDARRMVVIRASAAVTIRNAR